MNKVSENKIRFIEDSLHKLARQNCPEFMSTSCELCDIQCPYDQLFTFISQLKKDGRPIICTMDKFLKCSDKS